MKKSVTILLLFFWSGIHAQGNQNFVIVTVEKKTSSKLHPLEFDYWIVSKLEREVFKDGLIPLYIDGFSQTDINECCLLDTLVLFNSDSNESFAFQESFKKSVNDLKNFITKTKFKVQRIQKKWDGYKEEITVYVTPIRGVFCICELKHRDDNSKIGYWGKVAVPFGDFQLHQDFLSSQEFEAIKRFDYSELPFLRLHKMQ